MFKAKFKALGNCLTRERNRIQRALVSTSNEINSIELTKIDLF